MPLNKSKRPLNSHESPCCLRSIFRLGVVRARLAVAVGNRHHLVGGEVPIRQGQGTAAR
jgi:hypothetical protein